MLDDRIELRVNDCTLSKECFQAKPERVELVITGRKADTRVIEAADLVTEMKEIKHYYQKGIEARSGIEK